jgi:hypothetical protein
LMCGSQVQVVGKENSFTNFDLKTTDSKHKP